MKVLIVWPPHIPVFLNKFSHFTLLGEIGGYIKYNTNSKVDILDAGLLNVTYDTVITYLNKKYDVICLVNVFDNLDGFKKFIIYARKISKNSKILTFGPVSKTMPDFFKKYDLDAICYSGDYECAIEGFIKFVKKKRNITKLSGLLIKQDGKWLKTKKGRYLPPEQWAFPALEMLPLKDYEEVYKERVIKHKGYVQELNFTVSRGCPYNCPFCLIPKCNGLKERRRNVDEVIRYIKKAIKRYKFDYISFCSPTFTLDRNWVVSFCEKIINKKLNFKWKCVTTIKNIDEELIKIMSEAGCTRISFGVETMSKKIQEKIKKKINEKDILDKVHLCKKHGIIPYCYLMIGIPGQTANDINYTVQKIRKVGGIFRITAYSPLDILDTEMDADTLVVNSDRCTVNCEKVKGMSCSKFIRLIFNSADYD